jgi:glutathione S-transferase
MRWLAYVNSDLHPAFSPLFSPGVFIADESQHETLRQTARERLRKHAAADAQLATRDWLAGFRSIADPYFYLTVRWAERAGVDLSGYARIAAFKQRMEADAGVQAALRPKA